VLVPVLVVSVVALGLAVLLFLSRRVHHHLGLFKGEVVPPGAGPETTLLITDVQ
jgi:hypothetical protein